MSEEGISEVASIKEGDDQEDGILEAASENQPKRKRGRPPKWAKPGTREPYDYWMEQEDFPSARTRRSQQDRLYQTRAMLALIEALEPGQGDRFHWLMGRIEWRKLPDGQEDWVWPIRSPSPFGRFLRMAGMNVHAARTDMKVSVLAELGRIVVAFSDGAQWAIKFADQLCQAEPKLSVKKAAKWLRDWRLDRTTPVGTLDDLTDAIERTIWDYMRHHDVVTYSMIDGALMANINTFEWLTEEDDVCVFCGEPAGFTGCLELSEADSENKEGSPC